MRAQCADGERRAVARVRTRDVLERLRVAAQMCRAVSSGTRRSACSVSSFFVRFYTHTHTLVAEGYLCDKICESACSLWDNYMCVCVCEYVDK